MNKYELLYIVPSQYTDDEVKGICETVTGLVEKEGGKVIRDENLGKIKLAYPINRVRHGTYIVLHVEAESEQIGAINRQLGLNDEVLRHQIVLLPNGAEAREYSISSYVAPLSEEGRAENKRGHSSDSREGARPKPVSTTAPEAASTAAVEEVAVKEESSEKTEEIAPPTPAKKEEVSMSMEELDKKLDKILEGDVTENV